MEKTLLVKGIEGPRGRGCSIASLDGWLINKPVQVVIGAEDALFCGAWEIAGWVPIPLAFPPFSSAVAAFCEMVGDGMRQLTATGVSRGRVRPTTVSTPWRRASWTSCAGA